MLDNVLILEHLLLTPSYRQVNHRGSKLIDSDRYGVPEDTPLEDTFVLGHHPSRFDDVNCKSTVGAVCCGF